VIDEAHETNAAAGGGPLKHLQVAVGITEGRDWLPDDLPIVMATGLPVLSSRKLSCGRRAN